MATKFALLDAARVSMLTQKGSDNIQAFLHTKPENFIANFLVKAPPIKG